MFIRPCYRRKDGKRHAYWALVESSRTAAGPRQRVVAYLGQMTPGERRGVKGLADGSGPSGQRSFLKAQAEWAEVRVSGVSVERCRAFGGPWLGWELVRHLGLDRFLRETIPDGREDVPWGGMALVLVLGRLCDPSSELRLAEHVYRQSALGDVAGVPDDKINDDRLYRALDALLPHKEALEVFLKERMGKLFDLKYDLMLYDVTSTYFEGVAAGNPLAQRGYSRDHRPDCKQVCIALAVSKEGIPVGYEVFAGNRTDVTTLEEIVETMEGLGGPERGVLSPAEQRQRLDRRGTLDGLHSTDRGGGGLPDSQERPLAPADLASEGGAGQGAHPGVLPDVRALEDPRAALSAGGDRR